MRKVIEAFTENEINELFGRKKTINTQQDQNEYVVSYKDNGVKKTKVVKAGSAAEVQLMAQRKGIKGAIVLRKDTYMKAYA